MALLEGQVQQPARVAAAADLVNAGIQHPHRRRHAKVGAQPCLRDSMCSLDSTSRFRVLPFCVAVAPQSDDVGVRKRVRQRWAREATKWTRTHGHAAVLDEFYIWSGNTAGMSWVRLGSTDLSGTSASSAVEGPAIGNVAVDLREKRICTGIKRNIGRLL